MVKNLKIVAIVQSRVGSIRLPNKVMKPILGKPLIGLLLERLSKSKKIDEIIVATPKNKKNKILVKYISTIKHTIFQGDEYNVLKRYFDAASASQANIIVRITGDCPLIDPKLVDDLIIKFIKNKYDYLSNNNPPTYPDGLDVEIFNYKTLSIANKKAKTDYEREHVTPFIKKFKKFKTKNISNKKNFSDYRWTVDEKEDFEVIEKIFEFFDPKINFSWLDILKFIKKNPKLLKLNSHISRDEGSKLKSSQKLWKKAKSIIPGGSMLFSKRPELFLPRKWPTYFSKAKGCEIWDLDRKKYFDLSLMGVGTNILGYSHKEIDNSVIDAVKKSNMSTLLCPEEVSLAEKLIELHPWAAMVRFTRTGGEANSIAVRIARASSGKDKIAICGYHGWHDWYLSANIKNLKNLSSHLMNGLGTKGVPKCLKGSVIPFQYNNFNQLLKIVKDQNIGTIIMEVSRNYKPKNKFLQKVRKLSKDKGIVLIFDECSSGFRQCFGGIHKIYNVEPDIAMFGKALGNGYAISAIIGRKEIMENAQNTFISSTFWTERSGSVAALKTLEVMGKLKSWNIITQKGEEMIVNWKKIAKQNNLNLDVQGISSMPSFKIDSKNWLKYKTYITQEMLKYKFLASNTIYFCINHNKKIIDEYLLHLEKIFKVISECENGRNIDDLLEGPVCHSTFERLN